MASVLCISDNSNDRLHIVELASMSLRSSTSVSSQPYPVDQIADDLVAVSTRGSSSVDFVRVSDGSLTKTLSLPHQPRSTTRNPTKPRALIGGKDRSFSTLIDTGSLAILGTVGSGASGTVDGFGGGLASGHPFWIDNNRFAHLDRINRQICVYEDCDLSRPIACLSLPTTPHHCETTDGGAIVMCEGNPRNLTPPSVLKFSVVGDNVEVLAHEFLPVPPLSARNSGSHHLTIDSQRDRVYVGTNDSRLYVLALSSLRTIGFFDAGAGCGHVTLCPEINLAVTTNHTDREMTVFDLEQARAVGLIAISSAATGGQKTQGHTSRWDSQSQKLYTTAAQDGKVLEIDPITRQVTRELAIQDAYLIQGCFVNE